jgi:hypothetical protein
MGALCARWCHNRSVPRIARCLRPRHSTYLWTAPARSAGGLKRKSSRTIPARGCDSSTTTIPQWQRKPPFLAENSTTKCTFERRRALGSKDSRRGWPCSGFCQSLRGSDVSPACRQCAGWGPLCTHLSRDTVTAFRARPRAVRPIRARFPIARPSDARPFGAWYHIRAVNHPAIICNDSNQR